MCNTCGQIKCCCDSPTRYNGPAIPDVGIEPGTPYDSVIQQLAEFVSDIEFEDGVGISNIAWTSNSGGQPQGTQGTTDTYTVTLTDNSTYTLPVTNGADGIDGIDGVDGVGISNIAWTSNSGGQPQGTQGTTDTYTITLTDASTYNFVVTNGADGTNGIDGAETIFVNIPERASVTDPELIATIDASWFTTDGDTLDIECITTQGSSGGGTFEMTGIPTGNSPSVLYASHTYDNVTPTIGTIHIRLVKQGTDMKGSIKFSGVPDVFVYTDITIPDFIGSGSYDLGFNTTAAAEDSRFKELVIKRSKKV